MVVRVFPEVGDCFDQFDHGFSDTVVERAFSSLDAGDCLLEEDGVELVGGHGRGRGHGRGGV